MHNNQADNIVRQSIFCGIVLLNNTDCERRETERSPAMETYLYYRSSGASLNTH